MADDSLDNTDWKLLNALQHNARASYAELARVVSMSPSAVTERLRRLEDRGIIAGYSAVLDPERVGLTITAFVRLKHPTGNYKPFYDHIERTPEIVEVHHITGEDCFLVKALARSMRHLEQISGRLAGFGSVTTSVVYSSPLSRRPLGSDTLGQDLKT